MPANIPFLYENVFGVSPEASIRAVEAEVGPWQITFKVKEFLTGKPVEGVTVKVEGVTGTTNPDGIVTLTITGGTRIIIVSKSGYWTKTATKLIAEDQTIELSLVPIWMLVAGGVGAGGLILTIGLILARRG